MMSLKTKIERIEKEEIIRALQESDYVIAQAARNLGITERMIGYKIRKYKIRVIKDIDGGSKIINAETADNDIEKHTL